MAYKVLVIEDNTDCRELFAMIIRHLGFQVVEADDGEIGVQKALKEKPDLIFMDLGMPSDRLSARKHGYKRRPDYYLYCLDGRQTPRSRDQKRRSRSYPQTGFHPGVADRSTALPTRSHRGPADPLIAIRFCPEESFAVLIERLFIA